MMTLRLSLPLLLLALFVHPSIAQEYLPGLKWPEPKVVTPGEQVGDAPSDAVVLFDGKDLSAFKNAQDWKVEDGAMVVGSGAVTTEQEFGDCQLHIEWSAPLPAKGSGQGRGNSGVFFLRQGIGGGYEIQVLDSYQNQTYFDGQAGALYKQTPPMVNVMRPPGEWNTYDIFWTWPRFNEDGSLKSPATITAVHNGVLIQNHYALQGDTPYNRAPEYQAHPPRGPIMLQDHGNPVRFRNIWLREFQALEAERVSEPMLRHGQELVPAKKAEAQ